MRTFTVQLEPVESWTNIIEIEIDGAEIEIRLDNDFSEESCTMSLTRDELTQLITALNSAAEEYDNPTPAQPRKPTKAEALARRWREMQEQMRSPEVTKTMFDIMRTPIYSPLSNTYLRGVAPPKLLEIK